MSKDHRDEAILGQYNIICDASGFKIKSGQSFKQWDNAVVYDRFADRFRQPQDFVRAIPDYQLAPGPIRSEAPDTFISSPVLPQDL